MEYTPTAADTPIDESSGGAGITKKVSRAWSQIITGMQTIQQLCPEIFMMAWFAGTNRRVHYEGNLSVHMGGENVLTMLLAQLSSPLIQVRNNAVLRLSKAMNVEPELEAFVDDWPRSELSWGRKRRSPIRKRKGGRRKIHIRVAHLNSLTMLVKHLLDQVKEGVELGQIVEDPPQFVGDKRKRVSGIKYIKQPDKDMWEKKVLAALASDTAVASMEALRAKICDAKTQYSKPGQEFLDEMLKKLDVCN
jgi:hypothetical protein